MLRVVQIELGSGKTGGCCPGRRRELEGRAIMRREMVKLGRKKGNVYNDYCK